MLCTSGLWNSIAYIHILTRDNYLHCWHSRPMRQSLCNGTVSVHMSVSLSVCLSVRRLSHHSAAARRCAGLLLWARSRGQAISIDWLLHGASVADAAAFRPIAASERRVSSKCEQCHVVSWRKKLNTNHCILIAAGMIGDVTDTCISGSGHFRRRQPDFRRIILTIWAVISRPLSRLCCWARTEARHHLAKARTTNAVGGVAYWLAAFVAWTHERS